MTPYALFYHISHAAAVVRSNNTNTKCSYMYALAEGASPVFQGVVPSALRPEHVRLQSSATGCEPCLTPAHTVHIQYDTHKRLNIQYKTLCVCVE